MFRHSYSTYRLILKSFLPIPCAPYQCNSARRTRPFCNRATPLSLRHLSVAITFDEPAEVSDAAAYCDDLDADNVRQNLEILLDHRVERLPRLTMNRRERCAAGVTPCSSEPPRGGSGRRANGSAAWQLGNRIARALKVRSRSCEREVRCSRLDACSSSLA